MAGQDVGLCFMKNKILELFGMIPLVILLHYNTIETSVNRKCTETLLVTLVSCVSGSRCSSGASRSHQVTSSPATLVQQLTLFLVEMTRCQDS